MNSAQMDNVLTVTRLVATVVSIGTIGVLLWYGFEMRRYMRDSLQEMRNFDRAIKLEVIKLNNEKMAARLSVVQNSQYGQPPRTMDAYSAYPERAFCPTCKSTTAQAFLPATGKPLTTQCTQCGNTRPL